jgi:hypothetical protein
VSIPASKAGQAVRALAVSEATGGRLHPTSAIPARLVWEAGLPILAAVVAPFQFPQHGRA